MSARIVSAERCALAGMALGVALMLQPWWSGGLRAGFFVTALATIAQITLTHWPRPPRGRGERA
jgi:hypothetical protein